MKKEKIIGLTALLLIYIAGIALGGLFFFIFKNANLNILLNIFLCDVIVTTFVWLWGVILKTASVYDPYWSVQTLIIYVALLIYYNNWNLGTILFLVPLAIYTIRLTGNFVYTFGSLKYIDWRYRMLKEKSGKFFQLVNLLGICMFPTCVVYLASVPMFIFAKSGAFNPLQIIGLVIMLEAIALEFISDYQMHYFRKHRTSREQTINVGLWKYSRHPNYLGEISFWFGIFIVFVVTYYTQWYWIAGALVNLIMFLVISIPMEEKHMMEYKASYIEYRKQTSMLLILPRRQVKSSE